MKTKLNFLFFSPQNDQTKNGRKSAAVFFVGILLTLFTVVYVQREVENRKREDLKIMSNEIASKVSTRLLAHAQLLRSGAAYFSGSDTVTRSEWKIFNEREKINNSFPGFQGIGYAELIPGALLKQHLQTTRDNGFPDYCIKPSGVRAVYTSIIYLEPFEGRNLRAFGYDMFSDPIRRKAMEMARDQDIPALSGKVTLVQETNKDVQAGCLMYVPVYKNGEAIQTLDQRRKAIVGWVYSPYRMNDLMANILGHKGFDKNGCLHLQIYDETMGEKYLLFDSQKNKQSSVDYLPERSWIIPIDFNGKKWILHFNQSNDELPVFYNPVFWVFISGVIISLLLFSLSYALFHTRMTAERIALKLTAELSESKKKLAAIIEYSTDAFGVHVDGKWVLCNPSALTLFGFTSEDQLIGKSILEVVAPQCRDQVGTFVQNRIQEKEAPLHYLTRGVRVDGTEFELEVTISSYLLDKVRQNFFTLRDISESIKAKQALNELVKTKDKFFGIIAHDLRNPFNGILVLSNLIVKNKKRYSKEETSKFVEMIHEEAQNTYKLLENLLEWANIQTGNIDFRPEKLKLEIILLETISLLRNSAEVKNITIAYQIPDNLIVIGDQNMLNTVLRNLLSNAIKFTNKGGSVTIVAKMVQNRVEISVEDNGIGMSKEALSKLFQLNKKSSMPGTAQESGTGLGLLLCKEFVAKHKGEIIVESELGKGSRFWFAVGVS